MKNTKYIFALFALFVSVSLQGQNVEWAAVLDTASSEYSEHKHAGRQVLGVPNVAPDGRSSQYAWAVKPNSIYLEGAETAFIDVGFEKTMKSAKQVAVFESYNPGAVAEVYVRTGERYKGMYINDRWERVYIDTAVLARTGYLTFDDTDDNFSQMKDTLGTVKRKWWNIFKKDTAFQKKTAHRILNIHFSPRNVIGVRVVLNLFAIDGWNQIDAIGVSDSDKKIGFPAVDVVDHDIIRCENRRKLSRTVNSSRSELAPVISPDGKTLYFSRTNAPRNFSQDIWTSDLTTQNRRIQCNRRESKTISYEDWQRAKPLSDEFNNLIPNAVAGFSGNGKYMYLQNLYQPINRKCDCDSALSLETHGLSVCVFDTVEWQSATDTLTQSLDTIFTNRFPYFWVNPAENMLSAADSTGKVYVFFKEKKGWSMPRRVGNLSEINYFFAPLHISNKKIALFFGEESPDSLSCYTAGYSEPQAVTIKNFANTSNYINFHIADRVMLIAMQNSKSKGERDIFVSIKQGDLLWSEPKNIGEAVNTLSEESTPFLDDDGYTLFFSSAGHPGYGDRDIFVCKRLDDTWQNWSKPQNLGDTVNTRGSDAFFNISPKTRVAYFASNEHTGDCYTSDIFSVGTSRFVNIRLTGTVRHARTGKPLGADLWLSSFRNQNELGYSKMGFHSDNMTGRYKITLVELIDGRLLSEYALMARKKGYTQCDKDETPIEHERVNLDNGKRLVTIHRDLYLTREEENDTAQIALPLVAVFELDTFDVADFVVGENWGEGEDTDFDDDPYFPDGPIEPVPLPVPVDSFACGVAFYKGSLYKIPAAQSDEMARRIKPSYVKYFGYNLKTIDTDSPEFRRVTSYLKKKADNLVMGEKIYIYISSSASKVPATYNERLARDRGREAQVRILEFMKEQNIPIEAVEFNLQHNVQGPEYQNDADEREEIYKLYQYAKVWIYVCVAKK